ncbi:unnamed protein product [Clavelina lepadiformis]|uniref:DNA2/NAM7 helicase-like C-terminal domain-containing protein n=1 Tax=Clavelina lepadiformis TaxID=159417 RepID=A0ABP0G3X6_CLALP
MTQVYDYLIKLLNTRKNRVTPAQIGIISPYRKQVQKLRKLLTDKKVIGKEEIKIGSVEEFQGQERRVIIISTVRSNSEHLLEDEKFQLGFLRNPKRFNVALTRAMSLLIVVGNPQILHLDYYWNQFLNYCIDNGGYTGMKFDPTADAIPIDDPGNPVDDLEARMKRLGLLNTNEEEENLSQLQAQVDPPWRDEQ